MPIEIVTDTDVAAVPFAVKPAYSFRIDSKNKGPFAAMVPLSHLLDPAKEKDCIARLAGQFKNIPYEAMEKLFLAQDMPEYVYRALEKANQSGEIAKKAQARIFANCFSHPESRKSFLQLIDRPLNYTATESDFIKCVTGLVSHSSAEQRLKLLQRIEEAIQKYEITEAHPNSYEQAKHTLNGKNLSYTLEQIQAAKHFTGSTQQLAIDHYNGLKQTALKGHHVPLNPVAKYLNKMEVLMRFVRPAHKNAAQHEHMQIVIVGNNVDINHIAHINGPWYDAGRIAGGATGHGIYLSEQSLSHPASVLEEILHEVDKSAGINGGAFSTQQPYMHAMISDTTHGAHNPVFQYLTQYPIFTSLKSIKTNSTLRKGMQPLSVRNDRMDFIESLPDIYHYHMHVEQDLLSNGKIVIGNVTYTTADQVMSAALPNTWPLLEGAPKGMKLIQYASGKVEQIAHDADVPAGAELAMSLRESCDLKSGIKTPHRVVTFPKKAAETATQATENFAHTAENVVHEAETLGKEAAENLAHTAERNIRFGKIGAITAGAVVTGGAIYYIVTNKKKKTADASWQQAHKATQATEQGPAAVR